MIKKYLYSVNFQDYDEPLCAIEHRALFKSDFKSKIYDSDVAVVPSISPFIKFRLEVLIKTTTFDALLLAVEEAAYHGDEYKVKYVKLVDGDPYASDRKNLCKNVGMRIQGHANYQNPHRVYGLTCYQDMWYFGILIENNKAWLAHNDRPHTYSHSLKLNMAKVLVNLATGGDTRKTIIDPCCGAGTVLLEACFAGNPVYGSDINMKMSESARKNLSYFGYKATICQQEIEAIQGFYDCAIVDLPYGLFSRTTVEIQESIMRNAKRISKRTVIISSEDIETTLLSMDFQIIDRCVFRKSVNRKFARYIWVCETEMS